MKTLLKKIFSAIKYTFYDHPWIALALVFSLVLVSFFVGNVALNVALSDKYIQQGTGSQLMTSAGNNTVKIYSDERGVAAFKVTGDNPGVRSFFMWAAGVEIQKFQAIIITARVVSRGSVEQLVTSGTANGKIYIKDETGRYNTRGWNNKFDFTSLVRKDGEWHTYTVDISNARSDLRMFRFSIELTDGHTLSTMEEWYIKEVKFE